MLRVGIKRKAKSSSMVFPNTFSLFSNNPQRQTCVICCFLKYIAQCRMQCENPKRLHLGTNLATTARYLIYNYMALS
jgi:hypothetical protein